jgi:hypothetical protein
MLLFLKVLRTQWLGPVDYLDDRNRGAIVVVNNAEIPDVDLTQLVVIVLADQPTAIRPVAELIDFVS